MGMKSKFKFLADHWVRGCYWEAPPNEDEYLVATLHSDRGSGVFDVRNRVLAELVIEALKGGTTLDVVVHNGRNEIIYAEPTYEQH